MIKILARIFLVLLIVVLFLSHFLHVNINNGVYITMAIVGLILMISSQIKLIQNKQYDEMKTEVIMILIILSILFLVDKFLSWLS